MNSNITFYIADDHQMVVDGLSLLVKTQLGFTIVGTATDGDKAYYDLLKLKPHIALLDFRMPNRNGLQIIISLKKRIDTHFIILSMHDDKRYITDAMNNGAEGYLLKSTGKNELLDCIKAVLNGQKYFPVKQEKIVHSQLSIFTPREREILKLVIAEYTTLQIANELHLSHFTVETHRKNICRKTSTNTILGLVKYLSENNIEVD